VSRVPRLVDFDDLAIRSLRGYIAAPRARARARTARDGIPRFNRADPRVLKLDAPVKTYDVRIVAAVPPPASLSLLSR